jgi:O-succinylbenzoate synthase
VLARFPGCTTAKVKVAEVGQSLRDDVDRVAAVRDALGGAGRVRDLHAADVAVLKVQPLGGVRACLRIAEDIGLPVVVSSALETSVGIAAGVALAAALPELPYACGLATVALLTDDVAVEPLLPRDGALPVVRPEVAVDALARTAAPPERERHWRDRLAGISSPA